MDLSPARGGGQRPRRVIEQLSGHGGQVVFRLGIDDQRAIERECLRRVERAHELDGRAVLAGEHRGQQRLRHRAGVKQPRRRGSVDQDREPADRSALRGPAGRGDRRQRRVPPKTGPGQRQNRIDLVGDSGGHVGDRGAQIYLNELRSVPPVENFALELDRAGVAEHVGIRVVDHDLGHPIAVQVRDLAGVRTGAQP